MKRERLPNRRHSETFGFEQMKVKPRKLLWALADSGDWFSIWSIDGLRLLAERERM